MGRTRLGAGVLALLLVAGPRAGADETAPDAFAGALQEVGVAVSDLGYRPLGHWNRYPTPATTPYVLPFFADLHARPLDTYAFVRTLGNAVEDLVTPAALTAAPTKDDPKETLFRAGVLLATERRIGGFRGYSANLDAHPQWKEPLLSALLTLLDRSGAPLTREGSFGGAFQAQDASPQERLAAEVADVPEALHVPLARLVLNLVDAREWIDRGLRRVPQDLRDALFATLPTLVADTTDGLRYPTAVDDVARLVDEHSLWYGCLKALQATQDARREIGAVLPKEGQPAWPGFHLGLATPWGTVRIENEGGSDEAEPFLVVALKRPTWAPAPLGTTSRTRTLSVALLLDGAAQLGDPRATDPQARGSSAALASGVLGCGIVYAAGSSDTVWRTGRCGIGAGLFGLGAAIDEGGDDVYGMAAFGLGAGMFGAGLLLDAAGDDAYTLAEGDGQGFGGPNGIGVLGDRSGDDSYYAERDASQAGRADYHSENRIAANNAQGVGAGRRGDGSDGHNWAGGLGALLDVEGNDTYTAGNFSQGLGYWYGTGILWDGGGGDSYESVYFTQGSGAHFAIGALVDEGGDDSHVLVETAGAAFGFGWDVVNAFLIDRGSGNDHYEAKIISYGVAEVRSNAYFVDEGGDDRYLLAKGALGFGQTDASPRYERPDRTATFPFHLSQIGVFLDLGGKDAYLRREGESDAVPDPDAGDDRTWRVQRRAEGALGGFNVALGRDLSSGRLGFLDPWPARK